MTPPVPATVEEARALFARLQTQARAQGVTLRQPPPEPTTCCGRGCNGCVWEGWYAAAHYWHEDALTALASAPGAGKEICLSGNPDVPKHR